MYFEHGVLPETSIAPENQWLEDEISFLWYPIFQWRAVSFEGGYRIILWLDSKAALLTIESWLVADGIHVTVYYNAHITAQSPMYIYIP